MIRVSLVIVHLEVLEKPIQVALTRQQSALWQLTSHPTALHMLSSFSA